MSDPRALWVLPNYETGTRAIVMHDVDRLPGTNLPARTHIRVQDARPQEPVSIKRFNGNLTRSLTVEGDHVAVDSRQGPAVPRRARDVVESHFGAESAEVAGLVRGAIERVLADAQYTPTEALALERLRASVAGALQDDGKFDAQEIETITTRAAAVAPVNQR